LNIQDSKPFNEDPTLTNNGMVTRSSVKSTSWVNGAAQNENDMGSGTVVTPQKNHPGKVIIHANDSPAANARVGETVNRNTGESTGLLNGGQINAKPAFAH
jgi:hypothetical protein